MPKYLSTGSYSTDGLKGVLKDGGTKRVQATKQLIESLGGKLIAMYFAFGDADFFILSEGPDNIGSIAGTLIANATGAVKIKTTVLLDPEDIDKAINRTAEYRPPGQ